MIYLQLYLAIGAVAWVIFAIFLIVKQADDSPVRILLAAAVGALIWPIVLGVSLFGPHVEKVE